LNAEHTRIRVMIQSLLARIRPYVTVTYLVLDGHFGHQNAVLMARRLGLHLISNVRNDSTVEDGVETRIYQVEARHETFDQPLNVVAITKRQLTTGKQAHVSLFRTDRTLAWDVLRDDYHLRFQIECVFRDAKHYWGLEDFMVIKETAVTHAMNLAFFLVNLSRRLMRNRQDTDQNRSVLDLKAHYRGLSYAEEVIKLLPEKPEPGVLRRLLAQVTGLGRIHRLSADRLTG